jgi:hypothetical protein
MASKYGMQLYGADLYSSAFGLLEGDLGFSVSLAAPITKLYVFDGNVSFSFPMSATFTDIHTFEAAISVPVTFTGILLDINNLTGDISVPFTLTGELFRAATRYIEGTLPVSVVPAGTLSGLWPLVANPLTFAVDIGGGDDIYLGPFWNPDVPIEDSWTPTTAPDDIWAPASPADPIWVPATQDRQWGR